MDHGKNDDQRFCSVDDNSRAKYIDNKKILIMLIVLLSMAKYEINNYYYFYYITVMDIGGTAASSCSCCCGPVGRGNSCSWCCTAYGIPSGVVGGFYCWRSVVWRRLVALRAICNVHHPARPVADLS